ncbi:hypothetical protein [Sphingobacterium faecium]|uniref:hypothetical protein n=1 Tax=Sphingobacterium faecium TaxID=34087 RepID=UPI00320ADE4D
MNSIFENPIYITSISTLLGVAMTLIFTNRRERNKFILDNKYKELLELRTFYIDQIASLEKIKRLTKYGEGYKHLIDEMSFLNAKAGLLGSEEVNNKMHIISDLLYVWSSTLKKGLPRTIGNSGYAIQSSMDTPFLEKAEELEPELDKEIIQLLDIMKKELNNLKSKIK